MPERKLNTVLNKQVTLVLLAVFLWSTVATAFKLTLHHTTPETLFLISLITSWFVFLVNAIADIKNFSIIQKNKSRENGLAVLIGFINPLAYYLVLFKAYELLPAHVAQPLNYTWPLWLAVLSVLFLKERLDFLKVIALILGFAGILTINRSFQHTGQHISDLGIWLALLSAVIWASYWIIQIKIKQSNHLKLLFAFSGSLVGFAFYYMVFKPDLIFNSYAFIGGVYTGLFEMGITFLIWNKALEGPVHKSTLGSFIYLTPFISFLFIHLILGEKIGWNAILGLLLIVLGLLIQKNPVERSNSTAFE